MLYDGEVKFYGVRKLSMLCGVILPEEQPSSAVVLCVCGVAAGISLATRAGFFLFFIFREGSLATFYIGIVSVEDTPPTKELGCCRRRILGFGGDGRGSVLGMGGFFSLSYIVDAKSVASRCYAIEGCIFLGHLFGALRSLTQSRYMYEYTQSYW